MQVGRKEPSLSLCQLPIASFTSPGTAETAIHFVIYEHIKKVVTARRGSQLELTDCMWAAALAKLIASSMCYPHGKKEALWHAFGKTWHFWGC